jgi:hypothetical protein
VIIGVGGLMGAGEKNVAVPFDALKVAEKDRKTYLVIHQGSFGESAGLYLRSRQNNSSRRLDYWAEGDGAVSPAGCCLFREVSVPLGCCEEPASWTNPFLQPSLNSASEIVPLPSASMSF